jgi:3',5'-cyclic AMP phosphodiesterase CpdA
MGFWGGGGGVTAQNSQPRVLIAQISDLHVKPEGVLAYRRVDTAAALARCVKELNRFTPRPDLVVISGDLVDIPSKEAYEHLGRLLTPLKLPFAAIPGNHDHRDLMRAALPDRYAFTAGALHSVREVTDVDVVLIDSVTPGKDFGTLDTDGELTRCRQHPGQIAHR